MDSINLEPRYSTNEIPGKCIKCLAEKELFDCLRELLREEGDSEKLKEKYETVVAFLQSEESRKLRNESEKYLAEGKKVTLKISGEDGKQKYELEIE